MNSEIEQRIVAMYFDNKDFEKNAQQTIGTLGQLKENLKLEDSVKGFDELEKAGKKLNLNQAKTTVNNLKTALGGLGSAIQKAFNIGTAPIHALDNFFGTFRSYVGKFVGFDLASKFVNSLESALQQLTVAPIQAGWQMYQANVDSTKTIMSGTMKSYKEEMSKVNADWTYDEAEHMEFVKKHLRDLSDYAAQTVFSLSDMTSNVGKFTNQNIDLETSVTAMKGIANMTAKAGQGAQQASMAMYNFSQALGVGKMTTLDWKSIENANIATTELKDMFIMCAAAAGKLQKEVETIDGKEVDKFFITVDKNGKKLARKNWLEVSAENFRETLQQGWLDKDTMLHVMQLYSNEGFDLDTLAAWGFDIHDEELMKQLEEIGRSAMEAATQVRTFSKMWDALTESVQSSWADSMELIFGDMTEATTFWSTINSKIGDMMDSIGKNRNDMLREWRGETWDEESQAWIRLENSYDGREDLINGIYGIIDAAQSLGGAFSSAWSEVFGNLTGKKLQEITKGFREFIDGFKGWLGDMDDSNSRLSKIRNGLTGVFSVLKVIWEVVKNVFGVLKEAVKPLIEPIINLFSRFGKWIKLDNVKNLGEMLGTLRDRFSQLWSKLSGLGWSGVFGKIGEAIGNLWSQIREGVSRFLEDNGLGGVADWFVQLGDSIKAGFDSVVEWWNSDENKISGFFKGIWESVTGWFKPSVDADGHEVRSPIVQFFYRIRDGVTEAFEAVKAWWKESRIPEFFQGIWDAITGIFKGRSGSDFIPGGYNGNVDLLTRPKVKIEAVTEAGWVDEDGNPLGGDYATVLTNTFSVGDEKKGFDFSYNENAVINITPILADGRVLSPEALEDYMAEITDEAKRTGKTIKEVDAEQYGLILSYDVVPDDTSLDEAYEKAGEWAEKLHELQEQWDDTGRTEEEAPIVKFFNDTWSSLRDTFTDIMSWPIWSQIGTFFSDVWDTISGIFTPKDQYDDRGFLLNEKGNSPFVQFFVDTWEGIKNAYEEVKSWGIWGSIGTFFSGVWDTIIGIFTPKDQYDDRGFLLNEKGNSPFVQFFVDTWEGIKNAYEEVKSWGIWTEIGGFFSGVWDSISGLFKPKDQYDDRGFKLNKQADAPIVKFFKDTWESIKSVFTEISEWWNDPENSVSGFFKGIWEAITGFFDGAGEVAESVDETSQKVNDAAGQAAKGGEGKTEKSVGIITQLITTIKEFITEVFDKIAGVEIPPEVTKFFNGLTEFFLGVANIFGEIFGSIGRTLQGNGSLGDVAFVVFGAIIAIATKVADFLNTKNLAKIETQSFSQKFMSLAIGLLAVAAAVSLLTTVDQGKMWAAVGALTVLGVVIGAIVYFSNNIQAIAAVDKAQSTVGERLTGKLIDAVKMIGAIAVVMAMLPAIIDTFGKAKAIAPELSGLDIAGVMLGVVVAVVGISAGLALINKMTGGTGLSIALAAKSALSLMAFISIIGVVIGGLGAALEGIFGTENVIESINQGAEIIKAIGSAIGNLFGGLVGGLIDPIRTALGKKTDGEMMDDTLAMVDSLAERVEGFTSEKNSGIIRILNAIGLLSQTVKDIPDASAFQTFATQLDPLATGIMRFGITVNGFNSNDGLYGWDASKLYENIQKTTDIIGMFSRSMGDMGLSEHNARKFLAGIDYLNANFTEDRFEALGKITAGIVEAFANAVDVNSPEMSSMSGMLMDNLSKAIKIGLGGDGTYALGAFDATPIVDAIVIALGYGESAIATAVHDMVQNALNDLGGGGDNPLGLVMPDMGTLDPVIKLLSGDFGGALGDGNGDLLGNLKIDDTMFESLFGKGGTAENPAKDSVFGQLLGLQSEMEGIEFPDMSAKLTEAMKLTDAEGKPIDLVGDLRETLTSFEEELNKTTSFEIKIVPTYDFSNLNAEVLRNELRDYPINLPFGKGGGFEMPGMLQVDFSGINTALDLDGLKNRLDTINTSVGVNGAATVDAIERMSSHIDSISAAIAQIRVVVDMYGLIPAIDKALGERAAKSTVTGVSSMLSNPYAYVSKPETK